MQNIAGWFMMKKSSFEKGLPMRAWKMHLVVKLQCTFFHLSWPIFICWCKNQCRLMSHLLKLFSITTLFFIHRKFTVYFLSKEKKNNLHLNIYHITNLEAENGGKTSLKSLVLLAFSLWWNFYLFWQKNQSAKSGCRHQKKAAVCTWSSWEQLTSTTGACGPSLG